MTEGRLPVELRQELALHRAEASRQRLVGDLRRRRRAERWERVEEWLQAFVDRVAGRPTEGVCCA